MLPQIKPIVTGLNLLTSQILGLVLLWVVMSEIVAATPWWLIGDPPLTPGRPPLLAITTPTTSDQIYVTDRSTLDIAGRVASLSYIERVDWDSFNLELDDFLGYGQATLADTDYATVKQWQQTAVPLHEGQNEITVIAFDARQRSTMARLVVIKTAAGEEELFDDELAQKIEATACVGDPIDTATGSQLLEHRLLTVQGVLPITFTLNYNSLLLKSGILGRGWGDKQFSTRLEELPNGDVKIHWTNNRYNLFPKTSEGDYQPIHLNCQFDQLVKKTTGGFTLTRQSQRVYHFNAQGQLIATGRRNGQSLTLTYNAQDQLVKITEPVTGVFLEYNYNAEGLLTTVTDPLGWQAQLIYDDQHHLVTLIDAAGQRMDYTYNAFGQILTGTNAEGLQIFSNTYDEDHRLIAQDDSQANNQLLQLHYKTNPANQRVTTVTNRLGNTRIYVHNHSYQLLSVQDELGQVVSYTYDDQGQRRTLTDSNNHTTTFDYDTQGRLTTITDPAGYQTQFTYDSHNNLIQVINAQGQVFQFRYDTDNNLESWTDPLNQTTTYQYNEQGQIFSQMSPQQAITRYEYTQGQLTQLITPEGERYRLDYDAAGRLLTVTAPENHTTTLTYDGMNRLLTLTNPLGHTMSFTYNSRDQWINLTDAKGYQTVRHYDGNGNLRHHTNALDQTTTYEYDGEDRRIKRLDAKGRITQWDYDAKGRLIRLTNPLGHTQQFHYDGADNLLEQIDALGQTVQSFHYDERNNLVRLTNALQHTTQWDYDALNRLIQTTDPLQRTTAFQYDKLNRLIARLDALSGESHQSFDAEGNRIELIDPNHQSTTFEYDQNGRLIEERVATKARVKYSYNARDLLTQVTNARGQKRHLVYDAAGRLQSLTDPEGTVTYTYDDNGNVLTVTDASGTLIREYDALNRVTQYTNTRGQTLTYKYDEVGNLVVLTYPDGKKVHYEYNAADQLIQVTDWTGRSTRYEYEANGRLVQMLRPNGTQMSRHYDAAGQLVQQVDQDQQGHLIAQFDFDYDAAGRIVQEQMVPNQSFSPPLSAEMTYSTANQLATYNGQTIQFDADGNMIFGPVSGKMAELQFDSRNRLVRAGDTTYLYDAENQRVGVNQTRYMVNSQPPLSQVLVRTQADGTQTFYVYGLGLIGQETNGVYRTYHFDYRGSTVALTNDSGQVVEQFGYSPYGELVSGDVSVTPFLFHGRYGVMTDKNGLYSMRARFYSPKIRRFLNQDMLLGSVVSGQTLNRFAFVTGQPVSLVDPFGLETTVIITTDYYWLGWIIPLKIGSHAAMMIDNNNDPILYDPAGSYIPNQAWNNISREALGDVFQTGKFAFPFELDFQEYLNYHSEKGSRITLLFFPTTPEEEQELAKKIKDQPFTTEMLYCTTAVSNVLDGVGPFKDLGIFVWPSSLRDELLDRLRKR